MSFEIEYSVGDLLDLEAHPVIAHGCNSRGVAGGRSVAGQIFKKYPHAQRNYRAACNEGRFVRGTAQMVPLGVVARTDPSLPGWKNYPHERIITRGIYNLCTQVEPGADATTAAIELAFQNMTEHAAANGIERVAIPRIGCGIGGLEWDADVSPAIIYAFLQSAALAPRSKFWTGDGHHLTIEVVDLKTEGTPE